MRRSVVLLLVCMLFLTACAAQGSPVTPVPTLVPQGSEARTTYSSLSEFTADLSSAKATTDSVKRDSNNLSNYSLSEAEILFPKSVPNTKGIEAIEVGSGSIIFYYEPEIITQKNTLEQITVVWHRDIPPDIFFNNFPISDAITSKTIENENGVVFYVEEFRQLIDNTKTCYMVRWEYNGKSYSANVPTSYTDDDIFKLSDFENVLQMNVTE